MPNNAGASLRHGGTRSYLFSTLVHETAHEILHRTSRRAETRQTGAQERYSPVARELQRPCCPIDQ
jgi:hypothetical protein